MGKLQEIEARFSDLEALESKVKALIEAEPVGHIPPWPGATPTAIPPRNPLTPLVLELIQEVIKLRDRVSGRSHGRSVVYRQTQD